MKTFTKIKNSKWARLILLVVLASVQGNVTSLFAQGVSINGTGVRADTSAILDVSSTTKGVLISRMSTVERNSIILPAIGLHIFNTDTQCDNIYNGTNWTATCGICDFTPSTLSFTFANSTLNLAASTISNSTYSWTGPNNFISSLQNPTISNAGSANGGTYTLTNTINGCALPSHLSVNISCNTGSTVSASISPTSGSVGTAVSLSSTISGVPSVTYSWTGPNGYNSTVQSPSFTAGTSSFGDYVVVATPSNGVCPSQYTVHFAASQTFAYTGGQQTFTVPAGTSSITFKIYGAAGGSNNCSRRGGYGALITGTYPVTPGDVLYINVGGKGAQSSAGWNGGGYAYNNGAAGGGGASDVRLNGTAYSNVIIVAGGGGGAGGQASCSTGNAHYPGGEGGNGSSGVSGNDNYWGGSGGHGYRQNGNPGASGGLSGGSGGIGYSTSYPSGGGGGGGYTSGGTGGCANYGSYCGDTGTLGQGGNGYSGCNYTGGGGGGGYYGGGGSGGNCWRNRGNGAGGAGSTVAIGSGWTSLSVTGAAQSGNGEITINY